MRAEHIVAELAIWMYIAFILVTVVWRSWLQRKRTSDHGFRRFSARFGSLEWFGGVLIASGFVANFLSPVLVVFDVLDTVRSVAQTPAHVLGLLLIAFGFALTSLAQIQMGASWQDAVSDKSRRLDRIDANATLVPNLCSFLGLLSATVGLELHVRRVEEPFLHCA